MVISAQFCHTWWLISPSHRHLGSHPQSSGAEISFEATRFNKSERGGDSHGKQTDLHGNMRSHVFWGRKKFCPHIQIRPDRHPKV